MQYVKKNKMAGDMDHTEWLQECLGSKNIEIIMCRIENILEQFGLQKYQTLDASCVHNNNFVLPLMELDLSQENFSMSELLALELFVSR